MSAPDSGPEPPSEAREAARERARELREQHRKRDRRRRLVVVGSVGGVLVASIVVVALLFITTARPEGRGPRNMLSDGIRIGEGYVAERTPGLRVDAAPAPSSPNPAGVVDIRIYADYLCANCGVFTERNEEQLRAWIESGAATVEFHPIAMLTTKSAGTQYSLRAANAAACVAEFSPDSFFDFNTELFDDQPEEGTPGLSDDELVAAAKAAHVDRLGDIRECIETRRFKAWVQAATVRALDGPIPDSDAAAVVRPPTIVVNGQEFAYTTAFDPDEFAQFVVQAAGASFAAPTPSPAPSATPSPTP